MKKCLIVFLMLALVTSFVFAAVSSGLTEENNKATTNLKLALDGDEYLFGFSSNADYSSDTQIQLAESVNISDGTVSLVDKTFYFFYKAITDDSNVKFTINVTPLYLGGTAPSGTDEEKAKKTIHYTVEFDTDTYTWNGDDITPVKLDTSGTSCTSAILIKSSTHDIYLTEGIAEINLSSNNALQNKVPGEYVGTITVTLSSTS